MKFLIAVCLLTLLPKGTATVKTTTTTRQRIVDNSLAHDLSTLQMQKVCCLTKWIGKICLIAAHWIWMSCDVFCATKTSARIPISSIVSMHRKFRDREFLYRFSLCDSQLRLDQNPHNVAELCAKDRMILCERKCRKTVKDAAGRYVICGKNLWHHKDTRCDDGRATCFA